MKIKRYYLCSDDKNFNNIYPKPGKTLPLSTTNRKKAMFAGKYFAEIEKLKKWWVCEETTTVTRTFKSSIIQEEK